MVEQYGGLFGVSKIGMQRAPFKHLRMILYGIRTAISIFFENFDFERHIRTRFFVVSIVKNWRPGLGARNDLFV